MPRGYLRFPHLAGDLLTFVAEDDVWLAPLGGGKAWRITTDHVPVSRPRLSPDGSGWPGRARVDGAPEVHVVDLDGGERRRLTHFGVATTMRRSAGPPTVGCSRSSHGGESSRSRRVAYAVGLDGGPPERLPYGLRQQRRPRPGRSRAHGHPRDRRGRVVEGLPRRHGDEAVARPYAAMATSSACSPTEPAPLESPLWLDDGATIGFVSDRDGLERAVGGRHCRPTGCPTSAICASSPRPTFYVRHATSDGERVVFQSGGDVWLWDGGDAAPIDIDLGGERKATMPQPIDAEPPTRRRRARRRRTGERRRGARHGLVGHPPRRPGARPGSRAPTCAAGCPSCSTSAGDVAWVTDAERRRRHRVVERRRTNRRGTVADGEIGRVLDLAAAPGRLAARRRQPRRATAGSSTVANGERARDRSHRQRRRHRPGVLARLALARLVAPRTRSRWPRSALAEVAEPVAAPIDVTPLRFADTEPGVQHRRQVPGVPVDAQLRPDLRRLRVRPVVPQRLPAAARAARRDDPVAVRPRRRRPSAGATEGRDAPPS